MAFMFGREPMFVHLITLCLGLIIAFGLRQTVDLVQRRRLKRKAQEAERLAASDMAAKNAAVRNQVDEG